jgi:hypothetical protein
MPLKAARGCRGESWPRGQWCASGLRHKTFPKRLASDAAVGRRVDRRLKGAEWDGGPVQIAITVGMRQTGALMLVSFAGLCRRKCALAPPAPSHVSRACRQPLHNNNENNNSIPRLNLAHVSANKKFNRMQRAQPEMGFLASLH